jgi:hypothetical protein
MQSTTSWQYAFGLAVVAMALLVADTVRARITDTRLYESSAAARSSKGRDLVTSPHPRV